MMTGEQYKQSLSDGRRVFLEGDLIEDMANHPVFKVPVDASARLYDRGYDPTPGAVRETMRTMSTPEDLRHHASGSDDHDMLLGVTSASMMTLLTAADRIEDKLPENMTGVVTATPRELLFIQDNSVGKESVVVSSPAPLSGPVVYELRLAHR